MYVCMYVYMYVYMYICIYHHHHHHHHYVNFQISKTSFHLLNVWIQGINLLYPVGAELRRGLSSLSTVPATEEELHAAQVT